MVAADLQKMIDDAATAPGGSTAFHYEPPLPTLEVPDASNESNHIIPGGPIGDPAPSPPPSPSPVFVPNDASPVLRYPPGEATVPSSGPRADDLAAAAIVLLALGAGYLAYRNWNRRDRLMVTLKKRAATVICVGLAVMALGAFARYGSSYSDTVFEQALHDGYVAVFGAALSILGVYFWLTAAEPN